jgi:SAM-dependent methyltransferase
VTRGECRITGSANLVPYLRFGRHPVSHHFLQHKEQKERTYPFFLDYSEDSGLIQLRDVIPADELYGEYFNLSSSKRCPHLPRLVEWVRGLPLQRTSRIMEIACNDGHFLRLLRDEGFGRLLGVEPARDAWQASTLSGVETVNAYFNEGSARELLAEYGSFDLVIARHVIEHVADLHGFFAGMKQVLRPRGYVLLEVPDFEFCMKSLDYSALWEQHLNYFTFGSFNMLLARHGIEVMRLGRARFSGQAMFVLGRRAGTAVPCDASFLWRQRQLAARYRDSWPEFKTSLRKCLQELKARYETLPVYGAGCRTSSLLNFTEAGDYVDYFVDDESKKQRLFMPGSKRPIYSRAKLAQDSAAVCLLGVNAENERRVIAVSKRDGVRVRRWLSIHPPSSLLLPFWQKMASRSLAGGA